MDIAIYSKRDNWCILIESKINNAGDQNRQLYRYLVKTNSYPKTTITEVAWDMDSKLIYLFSQSGATIAKFTDIFEKSFEISINQVHLFDSVKELGGADKMEPVFTKIWGEK